MYDFYVLGMVWSKKQNHFLENINYLDTKIVIPIRKHTALTALDTCLSGHLAILTCKTMDTC